MNERHTISGLSKEQKHNCLELSNQFFLWLLSKKEVLTELHERFTIEKSKKINLK